MPEMIEPGGILTLMLPPPAPDTPPARGETLIRSAPRSPAEKIVGFVTVNSPPFAKPRIEEMKPPPGMKESAPLKRDPNIPPPVLPPSRPPSAPLARSKAR
jgi:hypothetical protein